MPVATPSVGDYPDQTGLPTRSKRKPITFIEPPTTLPTMPEGATYGGYIAASGAEPVGDTLADLGGGTGTTPLTFTPRFTSPGGGFTSRGGLSGGYGGFAGPYGGGGGGGGGGTLAGGAPRGYNPASGGIPTVTNPVGTITGSLGGIDQIIGNVTDTQLEALRRQYPADFFALQQMNLENAKRRAAGDISDLLPEMWTRNAENAVGGGYAGSALENTKRLRDMGLTRLGLEKGAEESMKNVFGTTPTVRPYDPSSVIGAIVDAQNRADIYAAAPVPEEAYKRARAAAGGGGGGGGGPGGAVRPATLGARGGTGGSSVDDILKRYGGGLGGYGPPIIARGTKTPGYEPYAGAVPYGQWTNEVSGTEDYAGPDYDFGGSLGWGGGAPWSADSAGTGYDPFDTSWMTTLPGVGGGGYGTPSPIDTGAGYDYGGLFGGYGGGYGGGGGDIEEEFYDF